MCYTAGDVALDSLGKKRPLEGIRDARNQNQDVEKRKGDGDASCANAGYSSGVSQRADEMDYEREDTDNEKLSIHGPITLAGLETQIMRDKPIRAKSGWGLAVRPACFAGS